MNVGEHYRPVGDVLAPGIYRVVGADGDVALLRVADAAGRRRHTGAVTVVAREVIEDDCEPAPDPDGGFQLRRWARTLATGCYWDVRKWF